MRESTSQQNQILSKALLHLASAYPAEFAEQGSDELREWLHLSEASDPKQVNEPIRMGILTEAERLLASSYDELVDFFNSPKFMRTLGRYRFARQALAIAGDDVEQFRSNLAGFLEESTDT